MKAKTLLTAAAIAGAASWYRFNRQWQVVSRLEYFTPAEFRGQWGLLSPDLLLNLDGFRARIRRPVIISPADGALMRIRPKGDTGESQHYYGRAADVMIPGGLSGNEVAAAQDAGFTGIGLYPHWRPYPGLHLDVRNGQPARWGGINPTGAGQYYVTLSEAMSYV